MRAAENQSRRLLPDAGADVVYPGSKADPALVRARIVLAMIFRHDGPRAKAELAAFKAKHPTASGTLAGKIGPLADTLQTFLDAHPKLPPDAASGTAWPTFGGAPDRAGRVPGGIPHAWPGRPSWPEPGTPNLPGEPARQPFGHPVIVNGEVFVTNGVQLYSFDLRTGKQNRKGSIPPISDAAAGPEANCTLTASDGLLYARVGTAAVAPPLDGGNARPVSLLKCLRPKAGGIAELWRAAPPEDAKVSAAWEGAPLVHARRLWAVYAKFEGGRVVHVAVCYDPADATADAELSPGRPAWVTELCDGAQPVANLGRTRQELLTLAGRNIVFCSNNGAVIALDAVTGRRAWGFRYPRARKTPPGPGSDPAPAVAFGGRVYVAPADGEHVYALDAETGNLVWETGRTEGARIVGVSRGRLIVAVAGPIRGIRGLDLETGSHRTADGGWSQDANVLTYGQGLVTDDIILWPTRDGLFFLDPRTGLPSAKRGTPNPMPGPHKGATSAFGQIAYAEGVIVVVTPMQVYGYRAQSMKIEHLPDASPQERFDTGAERAERALAAGNPERAITILAEVAMSDLPAPLRAWATARMLQIAPPATDLERLPREIRAALTPALLGEWIIPPDGVPVTLDAFLQRRLGRSPEPGSVPTAVPERPGCPPGLAADADFDRTLKLPPAVAPLRPIPGASCPQKRLFAAGPKLVVAVPLDQTAESEHVAADLFTHAANLRTGFVAAGPFAVAVYGTAREPQWVFRVPTTERLPDGVPPFRLSCGGEPACPQLSSFVLAGTWLLARIGDHHLVAIDLSARRVAWVLSSTGRAGYEPNYFPDAPRFGQNFAVSGQFVVVQLSGGRRWFVDLRTGKPVAMPALGDQTARAWWPHAPVELDGRLLFADGSGLVRLVQPSARTKWAFETDREDGLTGEPAQVRAWADVLSGVGNPPRVPPAPLLLVATRRNHGAEIERVDPNNGKALWSDGPAFADADRIDLTAADADADRVYVPAANTLLALATGSGKLAWKADLPAGGRGWIVRAGKSCVIVYPAEALPTESPDALFDRLTRSFAREPFVWRLPALAGTLYDTWVTRAVPVLLFDPETGKRLGRYDVPARGPAVTAHFGADVTVIATGDRVVWIK
jgi:outer membrane protein assembly factor BamB